MYYPSNHINVRSVPTYPLRAAGVISRSLRMVVFIGRSCQKISFVVDAVVDIFL